jgi:hypothetical protein
MLRRRTDPPTSKFSGEKGDPSTIGRPDQAFAAVHLGDPYPGS